MMKRRGGTARCGVRRAAACWGDARRQAHLGRRSTRLRFLDRDAGEQGGGRLLVKGSEEVPDRHRPRQTRHAQRGDALAPPSIGVRVGGTQLQQVRLTHRRSRILAALEDETAT